MINKLNSFSQQRNNSINFNGLNKTPINKISQKIKTTQSNDIIDLQGHTKSNLHTKVSDWVKETVNKFKSFINMGKNANKEVVSTTPVKYSNYSSQYVKKFKDGSYEVFTVKSNSQRTTNAHIVSQYDKNNNLTSIEKHLHSADKNSPVFAKFTPNKKADTVTLHVEFNPFNDYKATSTEIVVSKNRLESNGKPYIISMETKYGTNDDQYIAKYSRLKNKENEYTPNFQFVKQKTDGGFIGCIHTHATQEHIEGSFLFQEIENEFNAMKEFM